MTDPSAPIPRTPYAAFMAATAACAVGLGMYVARDAASGTRTGVAGSLVFLSLLCVIPLLGGVLARKDRWGLVVMATSVARTLLALGLMMALVEFQGLERRPTVMGILSGTALLMVAEAAVAVWSLSRADSRPPQPKATASTADAQSTTVNDQTGAPAPRSA